MMKSIIFLVLLFAANASYCQADSSFNGTEVKLETGTGTLFGTLLVPLQKEPMPVVLLIAGSGPTDRDGNNGSMKNNALKLLANGLAANNIASLRYDKRAIGASAAAFKKEDDLRFDHFVDDARGWVSELRKDKRFSEIIIAGHSEGSLIGLLAMKEADKFISIAGPGRPAAVVLREQLEKQAPSFRASFNPILDSLVQGLKVKQVPPLLNAVFRPAIQPYMTSWFKYDPAAELKKLKCPILIVQGTTDLQVMVKDAELLAAANANAKLLKIEGMNHVLKMVGDDVAKNQKSYSEPTLPLPGQLIDGIVKFIKQD